MMRSLLLLVCLLTLAGCGPAAPGTAPSAQSQVDDDAIQASKVLNIIGRNQPVNVALPGLRATGASTSGSTGPFNAALDTQDSRENNLPQLAEALPELN